ncbi:MAG: hypothetical protein AB7U75_21885 [Hyphomicrobiaceae bacterium]
MAQGVGAPRIHGRSIPQADVGYPHLAAQNAPPSTSAYWVRASNVDLLGDLDGVIELNAELISSIKFA